MDPKQRYNAQLNDPLYDDEYKQELKAMDEVTLEDAFYTDLHFGTAGIRAKMGAGTNRLNRYVIRKVSYAVAKWVRGMTETPVVAIAYDSRVNSELFAREAAITLASSGVKVYVFSTVASTPELSFAVRDLQADAGIVITASHNPKEYNGYKVYHKSGRQILQEEAEQIIKVFENISDLKTVPYAPFETLSQLILPMPEDTTGRYDQAIMDAIRDKELMKEASLLKVVYTPLHGTGARAMLKAFEAIGLSNVYPVQSQLQPDGSFPEVNVPNPEDPNVFATAERLGREVGADLLIATDPDADRIGVMVKEGDGYGLINGNEMGTLMANYLMELGLKGEIVTTVVSTLAIDAIAAQGKLPLKRVLTGFKYIGEEIDTGKPFLLGFEESYGYLNASHVRDKDAINAAMLVVEMALKAKKNGRTLLDELELIRRRHGYFKEGQIVLTLEGQEGAKKISEIMEKFRQEPPITLHGFNVYEDTDFLHDATGLPPENVLRYVYTDRSWMALRPSGTEPKLKVYLGSHGRSSEESLRNLDEMKEEIRGRLK